MSDDTLPTIMTSQGLQPLAPDTWRARLIALVAADSPGYTANLPGTLVEDIASTDIGALSLSDQCRVDLVNSVSPNGANDFLTIQLGLVYGLERGQPSNTSVEVVITAVDNNGNPLPGLIISAGFLVSDGQYQYMLDDGGITLSNGRTGNLSATATQSGIWAVPANSVAEVLTPAPTGSPGGINLSVTNPLPGTPGTDIESMEQFRVRVLRAGLATTAGTTRFLKTLVSNVPGVVDRLVSVKQQPAGRWLVIVGGTGDNNAVGNAIFRGMDDINALTGSVLSVTGITQAILGVVTTDHDHNYVTGQVVTITGINGMTQLNGLPMVITVLTNRSFRLPISTITFPPWVSGGVCNPVNRNVQASINDYPDNYVIPFVVPPQQSIHVTVTWNTTEAGFGNAATAAQLGGPAIVRYINSIPAGQPFNGLDAIHAFHAAIQSVLPLQNLSRVVLDVIINGEIALPEAGTYIYPGDPESYFLADASSVVVRQG